MARDDAGEQDPAAARHPASKICGLLGGLVPGFRHDFPRRSTRSSSGDDSPMAALVAVQTHAPTGVEQQDENGGDQNETSENGPRFRAA